MSRGYPFNKLKSNTLVGMSNPLNIFASNCSNLCIHAVSMYLISRIWPLYQWHQWCIVGWAAACAHTPADQAGMALSLFCCASPSSELPRIQAPLSQPTHITHRFVQAEPPVAKLTLFVAFNFHGFRSASSPSNHKFKSKHCNYTFRINGRWWETGIYTKHKRQVFLFERVHVYKTRKKSRVTSLHLCFLPFLHFWKWLKFSKTQKQYHFKLVAKYVVQNQFELVPMCKFCRLMSNSDQ